MAIANIPMPKSGIEAFNSGIESAQNIFNSINQNKTRIAETQRQQTILPYLLQQYKDAHLKSPLERKHLEAQIAEQYALAKAHQQENALDLWMMGGGQPGNNATNPATSMQPNQPGQNPAGMSRHDLVTRANQDQQQYDQNYNQQNPAANTGMFNNMTGQGAAPIAPANMTLWNQASQIAPQNTQTPMQQPAQQEAQPIAQQPPNPPQNAPVQIGQEEVIQPAKPGNEFIDQIAQKGGQSKRFKPEIQRDKTADAEGYKYTYWPSGKITRVKVAPSYEEKEQQKIDTAEKKLQNAANVKEGTEARKAGEDIAKSAGYYANMFKLIDEGLQTGPGSALSRKFKLNKNPKLAEFQENTINAQGAVAKAIATRPGAQVLKIAETGKPSTWAQPEDNIGTIVASVNNLKDWFNMEKTSYENATGKPYPVKEPEIFKIVENYKPGQKSLDDWAKHAIESGKDPKLVNERLAQLKAQQGGQLNGGQ